MNNMQNWIDDFKSLNARSDETIDTEKEDDKLSLQVELNAMDYRDMNFYKNLSDKHKKEISLWVLMRYMSSSQYNAIDHLIMVNEIVNFNFNVISRFPELQWKLLALCGTSRKQFHPWIPPGKKEKKNKLEEALSNFFPSLNKEELELLQKINTQEDFETFFKDNAFDDKTIKEIFNKQKVK